MSAIAARPPQPVARPAPVPAAGLSTAVFDRLHTFTVDEYHEIVEAGVIRPKDRTVLLEGVLVRQMGINPPHMTTLNRFRKLLDRMLPAGWDSRIQGPLTLGAGGSEPEPDYAIVRGSDADYVARHPGPAEVGLVVEVADSSLAEDRNDALRIYARAGLAEYWIVNIPDRQIEVYRTPLPTETPPRYTTRTDYPAGTLVPLTLNGVEVGAVSVDAVIG